MDYLMYFINLPFRILPDWIVWTYVAVTFAYTLYAICSLVLELIERRVVRKALDAIYAPMQQEYAIVQFDQSMILPISPN